MWSLFRNFVVGQSTTLNPNRDKFLYVSFDSSFLVWWEDLAERKILDKKQQLSKVHHNISA